MWIKGEGFQSLRDTLITGCADPWQRQGIEEKIDRLVDAQAEIVACLYKAKIITDADVGNILGRYGAVGLSEEPTEAEQ